MLTFEARIWEKAEHWTFDTTVQADSDKQARELLQKEYPKRFYSIRGVRQIWRA